MEASNPAESAPGRLMSGLGLVSLLCPVMLLGLWMAVRSDWIRFHDDYYGYGALAFLAVCAAALLPTGILAGGSALYLNRKAWLARIALAANALVVGLCLWVILPPFL